MTIEAVKFLYFVQIYYRMGHFFIRVLYNQDLNRLKSFIR